MKKLTGFLTKNLEVVYFIMILLIAAGLFYKHFLLIPAVLILVFVWVVTIADIIKTILNS